MTIYGLDPGYEKSTVVRYRDLSIPPEPIELPNSAMLAYLGALTGHDGAVLVIEQIESQGMAVGKETFETVFWSGRFAEAWSACGRSWHRVTRRAVKVHLCSSVRATDSNIRMALIDYYGPTTEKAIGKKKTPGPLFHIKSHAWAALAVAITWKDLPLKETI